MRRENDLLSTSLSRLQLGNERRNQKFSRFQDNRKAASCMVIYSSVEALINGLLTLKYLFAKELESYHLQILPQTLVYSNLHTPIRIFLTPS